MKKFILKTSILIELIGAVLLASVFVRDFGVEKGIWYGVFHSISAFCNAGFDLLGIKEQFSSLTLYARDPVVNLVIIGLIIIGGLGFLTWADVHKNKWHWKKYRMQSKVILVVSAVLIFVPSVCFYFFEFSSLPAQERLWSSVFQAVTLRTAGFNTADLTLLSEAGQMLMIILMLIGGSPGSTAGGMKTTTIGVLFSSAVSVFQKNESAQLCGRRISDDAVKNAATIFMLYVTLFLGGGMFVSSIEGISLMSALFETSSAIGTVGLSLGITPSLGYISRGILIGLMFFGRVGGLTLIFVAFSERNNYHCRLPQEKITVG